MKICPICEKEIEGNFCRYCFRFVTPWKLHDDIYINKSHSHRQDKNCDYHSPKTVYSKQEYMQPGYENKIYGSVTPNTQAAPKRKQTPSAVSNQPRTRKQKSTGNVKKGSGVKGYIVSVIILLILVFLKLTDEGFIDFSDFSWFHKEPEPDISYENPAEVSAMEIEEEDEEDNHESIEGYLKTISFVDTVSDHYGTYYYYDPDDIVGLTEYHCDYGHFDMTVDEFEELLLDFFDEEPLEKAENREPQNNYLVDDGYGNTVIWLETEYEWDYGNFSVTFSADTASNELHEYEFLCEKADDEFYNMIYRWCERQLPGRFDSGEDFKEALDEASGYLYEFTEDGGRFKVFGMSDFVSVKFSR